MNAKDLEYLARRAEQEVYLASRATNRAAAAAHYRLSTAYLERLHEHAPANDRSPAPR